MPGYIIVQLFGATLACLFLLAVFGNVEHLGATLPGPGYHDWQALLMEIALTAVLVSVILGTASGAGQPLARENLNRPGEHYPELITCRRTRVIMSLRTSWSRAPTLGRCEHSGHRSESRHDRHQR